MKEKCLRCGKVVPWVCFCGNITLACFKIFVGVISGSKGLVADGMHSASDVVATIMVLISLSIAAKEDDKTHPWGHGKIEFAGATIVYTILLGLSIYLFQDALREIIRGTSKPPHLVAFIAALVSIVANFILSGYGFCAGKRFNSPAMVANANENKADMFSSIAVVIGIIGANMGFFFLDAVAAILVSLIIFKTAFTLGRQAFRNLLDISLPAEKVKLLESVALQYKGVKGINFLNNRRVGQSVWVDMEILTDSTKTVREAYVISREVRLALMRRFKQIKDISISFTCRERNEHRGKPLFFMRRRFKPTW
ncbi:MAG: cation transporter [Candidatus Omnitrophota bacterium]|nr:MAG: cation transporter [Candidatus Omnitrophota bacterium]